MGAYVLICTRAAYLVWHLFKVHDILTFTDEAPSEQDNPLAPAPESKSVTTKAVRKRSSAGNQDTGFVNCWTFSSPLPATPQR